MLIGKSMGVGIKTICYPFFELLLSKTSHKICFIIAISWSCDALLLSKFHISVKLIINEGICIQAELR